MGSSFQGSWNGMSPLAEDTMGVGWRGRACSPFGGGNARRRVAGAVRREVRRYLQMRMAMLVSTEVTESQVEMARTELSLLVDWPIFTLLGST